MKRIRVASLVRAGIVFGSLLAFPFFVPPNWVMNIAFFSLMYAALASSWNLFGGYSGYVSLGHVAFFGLGAYAIAIAFQHGGIGSGYVPFLVLPLVGIGAAVVSLPIARVAFRTRRSTFAIVTLTFLFVVQTLAFNLHSLTKGSQGIGVAVPVFPLATYERPFYLAMLAVLALAVLCCWYVRGSKLGLMLFAIRDDEDRARGVGVQTNAAKLFAFAMSVGLTAMVGGIWAYYVTFISPAGRGRSPDHDRRRADGVSGREGHPVGAGPGRRPPRHLQGVPGVHARRRAAVPHRLLRGLPGGHRRLPRGIIPSIGDRIAKIRGPVS